MQLKLDELSKKRTVFLKDGPDLGYLGSAILERVSRARGKDFRG